MNAIKEALTAAGLPYRPCGLNADWSVEAYHCGPSATPNATPGDLYILDDEDGTFAVAHYYPGEDFHVGIVCEGRTLAEVVARVLGELSKGVEK